MPEYLQVKVEWTRNDQIVFDTLYMAVQYIYGMRVEGDVIEFGTMSGNSACALALGIVDCDSRFGGEILKNLWLLDSFSGLPESSSTADLESPHVKAEIWGPGTCYDLDELQLSERVGSYISNQRFNILKGLV
jgi:hypothetical protein